MNDHIPVLTKEVLQYLAPKPNENFIDGTVGGGGHAGLILEKTGPAGKLLGIDLDEGQIENSKKALEEYGQRASLVNDSYANMQTIIRETDFCPVDGILLDVGYSSWQIEHSQKGFSFNKDEPLDMRYSQDNPLTAEKIVNEYSERDLEKIFEQYGEEKFARRIAKEIASARQKKKIGTTFELKDIIGRAVPGVWHGGIHFATRTFQAIRIAVNDELKSIEKVLPDALDSLAIGGRLVVISFHSLEDKIVKKFFAEKAKEGIASILTKKPVTASEEEILANPRCRSAKLRAIIKNI